MIALTKRKAKAKKTGKGYNEDFPTDAGMTLRKLPEKIPAKKKTSVPGKQGTGTKEGPAQELPELLGKRRK